METKLKMLHLSLPLLAMVMNGLRRKDDATRMAAGIQGKQIITTTAITQNMHTDSQ